MGLPTPHVANCLYWEKGNGHSNIHLLLYSQTNHNLCKNVQIYICIILCTFTNDLICSRIHMRTSFIGGLNLSRGLDWNEDIYGGYSIHHSMSWEIWFGNLIRQSDIIFLSPRSAGIVCQWKQFLEILLTYHNPNNCRVVPNSITNIWNTK